MLSKAQSVALAICRGTTRSRMLGLPTLGVVAMSTPASAKAILPPLAVTGATGAIGGQVARILADAGVALRLLVRNVAKAPDLPGSSAVRCSYGDHAAAVEELRGTAAATAAIEQAIHVLRQVFAMQS
jgi:hypothetical protein